MRLRVIVLSCLPVVLILGVAAGLREGSSPRAKVGDDGGSLTTPEAAAPAAGAELRGSASTEPSSGLPRVALTGIVTLSGRPVRGVEIRTRGPYGSSGSAVSDSDGRFSVEVAARPGSSYRVRAMHKDGFANARFSYGEVVSGPVRIELADLFYERFDFRDEADVPVPVAGLPALYGLPASRPVWSNVFNAETYETDWLPPRLSVRELREHEVAYVVAGLPASKRAGGGTREVRLPGFSPTHLPVALLPIERWPEARRVVLTRDPSEPPAVPHHVVFPPIELPSGWTGEGEKWLDLVCAATTETEPVDSAWLNPANPVFRLPRGTRFRFQVFGDAEPLSYRLHDLGDVIQVFVDWPRYAFLDLRFPARASGSHEAMGTVTVFNEGRSPGGQLVGPGHARFAYLPEGDYWVRVEFAAWRDGRPTVLSSRRTRERIRLVPGLNSHALTEDDLVAADGR